MKCVRNICWNGFASAHTIPYTVHSTHTCAHSKTCDLPALRPLTGDEMVVFVDYILLSFINDTNNVCTFMSSSCAVQTMPVNSLSSFRRCSAFIYWCVVNWREHSVHTNKNVFFSLFPSSFSSFKVSTAKWLMMMMVQDHG